MNFNLKKLFKLKINNTNKNKYKYESLIDEQININNNIEKNKYSIGNFKVNRKIPNKEELKKIYENFIKDKQININKIKFNYVKNIENLMLKNDNQYILIHLDLKKEKRYKINIYFYTKNISNINFIFTNNTNNLQYSSNKYIHGDIHFCSNHKDLNLYNQLYILFNKQQNIFINNFKINIQEINDNNDYNISLIKNNNKIIIF